MITITDKSKCCGCTACMNACPQKCISMVRDENGFLYPTIDQEKCVNCNLCSKVCPITKKYNQTKFPDAYIAYLKDENYLFKSSSGGMFFAVANYVLSLNGEVYGAGFDEDFNVRHLCATNLEELQNLMKSKYVESSLSNTFSEIKEKLESNKLILFSGTPCQVHGLKSFLNKDYKNLISIDIACQGTPSPLLWEKYKNYLQKSFKGKLTYVCFRDKSISWKKPSFVAKFDNGRVRKTSLYADPYSSIALSCIANRPSCFDCHFKSYKRESDFSIADCWGVEDFDPSMFNIKGTSLLFIQSERGQKIFDNIKNNLTYKSVDIKIATERNPNMISSVKKPDGYDLFFKELNENDFKKVLKKYGITFYKRLINKVKKILKIK